MPFFCVVGRIVNNKLGGSMKAVAEKERRS